MERRKLIAGAALASTVLTAVPSAQADEAGRAAPLNAVLQPLLTRHGLPALAAAVMRGGQLIAVGATGTRRMGVDAPVAVTDRFHIGSNTKAMTSLLAGMLVEEGALRWDSTAEEIFPGLRQGSRQRLWAALIDAAIAGPSRADWLGMWVSGAGPRRSPNDPSALRMATGVFAAAGVASSSMNGPARS